MGDPAPSDGAGVNLRIPTGSTWRSVGRVKILRERIFHSPLGPYLTIGRLHLAPLGPGALGGLMLLGITLAALS